MSKNIAERIVNKMGYSDLIRILTEEFNGSELNSILLDVFEKRTAKQTPSDLLKQYDANRFVKASSVDVIKFALPSSHVLRNCCELLH